MKKSLFCLCLTLFTAGLLQNLWAQKSKTAAAVPTTFQTSGFKGYNEVLADPGKGPVAIKRDLSILLVPLVKRIEAEKKANHQMGELNFFSLLNDVPVPVYSLSKAKSVDIPGLYDPYIDKVDRAGKNFAATFEKHNKNEGLTTNKHTGKDAHQVAKDRIRNPSGSMGRGAHTEAMNRLMQDMMKDPKLAARFEKMSEKEKEVFMRPYFSESIPRDDAAFEKTMAERNEAKGTFNLTQLIQETGKEILAAKDQYNNLKGAVDSSFAVQYNGVESWFKERYNAIPTVVVGEGHDKDPKQLSGLYQARAMILYQVNAMHAELLTEAWHSFSAQSKAAVGKFDAFVGNYKWGTHDNVAELGLLGGVQEVYGLMGDLSAGARAITVKSKAWQLDYERQSVK